MFLRKHYRWLLPLIALLLIAPITPFLDIQISNFFYHEASSPRARFPANGLIKFAYDYGFIPADTLCIAALIFWFFSFFLKRLHQWRAPAAILAFTMLIGSGLIVHLILKDHWGRPRPVQTIQFGGSLPFQPFYLPNFQQKTPAKSFPCGHCTAGFYFLTFVLLGKRYRNKGIYWLGVAFTLIFGAWLSYSRIAMGGHFFSDVLVSALIMWWTALSLDWLLYK